VIQIVIRGKFIAKNSFCLFVFFKYLKLITLSSALRKLEAWQVAYTCNPSILEPEAGGSGV
jgi:hypothetical protein